MKNQESLTSSGGAFSMIGNDKKHESIGRNVINSFLISFCNACFTKSATKITLFNEVHAREGEFFQ